VLRIRAGGGSAALHVLNCSTLALTGHLGVGAKNHSRRGMPQLPLDILPDGAVVCEHCPAEAEHLIVQQAYER